MLRSVYEVQRDFAQSCVVRSEIIWDSLSPTESCILKHKIETLLPETGDNKNGVEKLRKDLFDNIWSQRKYTNRTLLSTIIYVLVTDEIVPAKAMQSSTFSCHPVFRTRKCLSGNQSASCCMIFIDLNGRVYKNWEDYVKNNILPKGTMIAPANGMYTLNDFDEVKLELHLTPITRTSSKILNTSDTIAAVSGFLAAVPVAAALSIPIAAPVMIGATIVGVSSAAYSAVRSTMHLIDRGSHDQSLALSDRTARNSWFGVAGGFVGVGATGATRAITYAASAGRDISMASQIAVNSINISSLVLSGTGVANGVYDLFLKINNKEELTSLDVLNLASSLLVFTHSINNIKLATSVATKRGSNSLSVKLNNQIRDLFNRINGNANPTRTMDVIRTINDIPISSTLMSLHKLNAKLISDNGDASGMILSGLPKLFQTIKAGITGLDILYIAEQFGVHFANHITNSNSLLDVLNAIAKYFCEGVFYFLLNIAKTIMEEYIGDIEAALNTHISTEEVLYRILMHCVRNYSTFTYDFLERKTIEIIKTIEEYFDSLNPVNYANEEVKCKSCNGCYYICKL